MGSSEPVPIVSRAVRLFPRHPVTLLFAFTPGIPEYRSGSSAVSPVVTSPLGFLLFLGLLAQIGLPIVFVVNLLYGLFFYTLWKHHRAIPAPVPGAAPA